MARILVTGASTGLGLLTADSLREAGHEVMVHARHAGRFEGTGIPERMHGVLYGDLSDLDETRRLAEQADRLGTFDAVIHNAGVIKGPEIAAVNVVAPYMLTALMQPPARMIVVSSSLHRSGEPESLERGIVGRESIGYDDSKLFVTALAMGIARRWTGVMVHALCPGWVPTRMGGPSATDDLTEGHRTQEWLATAPPSRIRPVTGGYWHHLALDSPHPATLDPHFQDEVIAALERRTGIALPA